MRPVFILCIVFFLTNSALSQIISFTDLGLKSFLINEPCVDTIGYANGVGHIDVDLNNDNEIQYTEALSVLNLNLGHYFNHDTTIFSIQDLNHFINLRSLDISAVDNLSEIANLQLDSLKSLHIEGCNVLELIDISNLVGLSDELRIESTIGVDYINIQNGSVTSLFSMFYSMDAGYVCIDSIAQEYSVVWGQGVMLLGALPSINCTTVGIENRVNVGNEIQIYPNPTNGAVEVISEKHIHEFIIMNSIGEILLQSKNLNNTIDLSQLKSGVYFIRFLTSDGMVIKKTVKK